MEADREMTDPDDDWEDRSAGRRTYRVPEGRPSWVQPQLVDLVLPVISPRLSDEEDADGQAACHDSGSADRWAAHTGNTSIAEIIADPSTHQSDYVVVDSPETDSDVPQTAVETQIHHSTIPDYEPTKAGGANNSDLPPIPSSPIQYSEATDYGIADPQYDPPIQEFEPTNSPVEIPPIAIDLDSDNDDEDDDDDDGYEYPAPTPRRYQAPSASVKGNRFNDDPLTAKRSHTYRIKTEHRPKQLSSKSGEPGCRQRTKYSLHRPNSGSGRAISHEPGQRNRVGSTSTRRVNPKYFPDKNRKLPEDRAALAKGQTQVNRKLLNGGSSRGGRDLMTSSVTTVLTPRPYGVHRARSSSSLNTHRMIASSAKPEAEMHRRRAATQSRVRSRHKLLV